MSNVTSISKNLGVNTTPKKATTNKARTPKRVAVGQVYADTNHNGAVGSQRRLVVKSITAFGDEARIAITHDRQGNRLKRPVEKYVKVARFNGRARGFRLLKDVKNPDQFVNL